jgi:hypothetical protein
MSDPMAFYEKEDGLEEEFQEGLRRYFAAVDDFEEKKAAGAKEEELDVCLHCPTTSLSSMDECYTHHLIVCVSVGGLLTDRGNTGQRKI